MPFLENQKGFQNIFHHHGSLERCFGGEKIARKLSLYNTQTQTGSVPHLHNAQPQGRAPHPTDDQAAQGEQGERLVRTVAQLEHPPHMDV